MKRLLLFFCYGITFYRYMVQSVAPKYTVNEVHSCSLGRSVFYYPPVFFSITAHYWLFFPVIPF